ncbi:uncharacterized protein LOC122244022 [Penaeus japonicus]|uniref:uncharacterized protein LOC122244022 n=1 Tax=Penaeus japonicus TaxID=27405 RepID=UPI001C70B917|nr:uncharacterized protein LOC122244022 [Penaeus japonicus]
MGRLCLFAWMATLCLFGAPYPVQGALREMAGVQDPLRLPMLLYRDSLTPHESLWPRVHIPSDEVQTPFRDQQYEYPEAVVGVLGMGKQGPKDALSQPTEQQFVSRDSEEHHKGMSAMKRALSLWAALHSPVGSEAVVKPAEPEGDTPLRPVGVNPLRWGR